VTKKPSTAYQEVYKVVRRIPSGRVATYGQVAKLLPKRWSPALVGWALHALPQDSDVPWFRVVDSQGRLGTRRLPGDSSRIQELLLADEGIPLDGEGRLDLAAFQWDGEE
jgi:methylated-DNA-protein-cysteine methyltransferase-like protein